MSFQMFKLIQSIMSIPWTTTVFAMSLHPSHSFNAYRKMKPPITCIISYDN